MIAEKKERSKLSFILTEGFCSVIILLSLVTPSVNFRTSVTLSPNEALPFSRTGVPFQLAGLPNLLACNRNHCSFGSPRTSERHNLATTRTWSSLLLFGALLGLAASRAQAQYPFQDPRRPRLPESWSADRAEDARARCCS